MHKCYITLNNIYGSLLIIIIIYIFIKIHVIKTYSYLSSENYLPIENTTIWKNLFPTIKHLTLTRMNYNWSDIQQCMSMFPSTEELSISFNIVTIIEDIPANTNLINIVTLILEGNLISNWDEVLKLGFLPW